MLFVYLPFFVITALILVFGVPFVLEQSRKLLADLPRLLEERILTPLEKYVPLDGFRSLLPGKRPAAADGQPVVTDVKGAATFIASSIAVLFVIFYMLIDAQRLRNLFLLGFPSEDRSVKKALVVRMGRRMSAWLSAQLLLAGVIAGVTFVVLLALRIPYALPLALMAGIGEMIPVVGLIVGAIPALAVALFQSPWQFWSLLVAVVLTPGRAPEGTPGSGGERGIIRNRMTPRPAGTRRMHPQPSPPLTAPTF